MEKLDLYDINKLNTHQTIYRGDKVPEGLFRYVVHVCIFNSQGKMLIQKRSKNKKYWPNMWDISVGGCVSSGESSQEAMTREVKEEIGVDIDFTSIRPAFTFSFSEGYDDLYIINKDINLKDIKLQESEVQEVKYASLEEVNDLMKKGLYIKYQPHFMDFIFNFYKALDIFIDKP